jgi:hypothetical protein
VRNFFRNMALLDSTLLYRAMDMPIVIAGSGPGLESVLPQIFGARKGIFVLAASSSLPALMSGGIVPDMVIATDGGGWAHLHLHACFRMGGMEQPVGGPTRLAGPTKLAFALCAAVPSQCAAMPLLPMNDGTLWQSLVLHSLGIPSALVPQRGTVTASALELAMLLGRGNIFLAGMDLALCDIKSHARPYGFDHLFFGTASRFRPFYSQCFSRSRDIKAGGSHNVYAAWFKSRSNSWPKRIFSLGGNSAHFPAANLPLATLSGAGECAAGNCFKPVAAEKPAELRRRQAGETLIAALGNIEYAAILAGELAPLLFPSRTDVAPVEIADALELAMGEEHG